jgi:hypothetical protein
MCNMGVKETREIDRFRARSADATYDTTIIIYQGFIDPRSLQNPHAQIPGFKEARTIDGYACNRKSDEEFEVVNDPFHPGMIVYRVH